MTGQLTLAGGNFKARKRFKRFPEVTRPNAATADVQSRGIPDSTARPMDQASPPITSQSSSRMRAAAFSVHIFTALGAGIALIAMLEAVREHWTSMFAWLGVALVIDAIDGPIARRLDVVRLQPNWSGDILDLVVDFLTYVFVPAYAITASGLLLPLAAPVLGIGIVVSSALYFADRRMKAADNHFRGFPALWNAVAFYLFLLHMPPALSTLAVAILIVLTFVPIHVLHPVSRRPPALADAVAAGGLGGAGDDHARLRFQCRAAHHLRPLRDRRLCRRQQCRHPFHQIVEGMIELLTSAEAWAALLTLTALEIVLGIDNVIFISVLVSRIPEPQATRARQIGLALALVFRILLLSLLVWLIGLTEPVITVKGVALSWRDIILIAGGMFLIAKATHEIHAEVEANEAGDDDRSAANAFFWVIMQIIVIDMVFSLDSIITAIGMAQDLEIMVAAVVIACVIMYVSSGPVARFVAEHPTTKMLALAFLVLIGVALVADGFKFHIPRGYIYFAITFSAAVEFFNVLAKRNRRKAGNRQSRRSAKALVDKACSLAFGSKSGEYRERLP